MSWVFLKSDNVIIFCSLQKVLHPPRSGLSGCLKKPRDETIEKFIKEFNDDSIKLDDTMYAFQSEEEEDFDED